MHDEKHIINNNMAYGLLQVGAASYVDTGVGEEQPYEPISYGQGGTLTVTLYAPSANLDAIARFDLRDMASSSLSIVSVGNPFDVVAVQGSDDHDWGDPIAGFSLRPEVGDPPAVIMIDYTGADLTGFNEDQLSLYRLNGSNWEQADRTCGVDSLGMPVYALQRFLSDHLLAVPICRAGTFVLSDETPTEIWRIFLPLVLKKAP